VVGVDTVEMEPMSVGFGDMDEHAGQKIERVEQGLVVQFMSCFGLVDEELGQGCYSCTSGEGRTRPRA